MKRIGKTINILKSKNIFYFDICCGVATNKISQIFNFADSNKENNLNTYKLI